MVLCASRVALPRLAAVVFRDSRRAGQSCFWFRQLQHAAVLPKPNAIAPHDARCHRRCSTSGTASSSGATTRRAWRRRHPNCSVPQDKDLPVILTAAGMVELCGRSENRGAPLIGLDVAPSNFGVAISDDTRTFSIPLTKVLRRASAKKLDPSAVLVKLRDIIEDSSACGLVVGWPLSLSGRAEGQCLMVLQFLRQLHLKGKVSLPVTLCDERLTSVEARGILREDGLGRQIGAREDQTAAMVILQAFLDSPEAERGGLSTLPREPGWDE